VLYWPKMANHGRSWFVGAIFIISFFTYLLAVFIGSILEFLKNFFKIPPELRQGAEENKKTPGSEEFPNLWRPLAPSLIWMKQNWWVGDFKQKEGEVRGEDPPNLWRRGFKWIKATWLAGDFKEHKDGDVQVENSKPTDPPNRWRRGFKRMKAHLLVSDFHENDQEREARVNKPKLKDSPTIWRGIGSSFKWMKPNRLVPNSREDDKDGEARELKPKDPLNDAEQGKAKVGSDNSTEPNGIVTTNAAEVPSDAS
jgi:hypothetical protein